MPIRSSVLILVMILLNVVVAGTSTLSAEDNGSQNRIIIDVYEPGSDFNVGDYDVIVGFDDMSVPDGYTEIIMNDGGILQYMVLNTVTPAQNNTFAPFTIREVRLVFNKLVARRIPAQLPPNDGIPIIVPVIPGSPSYAMVRDIISAFYTMNITPLWEKAVRRLESNGAYYNETDGKWYYAGSVIKVRIVYRSMGRSFDSVIAIVASVIEEMGFIPVIINATLPEYLGFIYNSDPSMHEWDILFMTCTVEPDKYNILPAYLYSSWDYFVSPPTTYLPRVSGNKSYMNYTIDLLIRDLLHSSRGSREWINDYRKIIYLGLMESATIPLVYHPIRIIVRDDLLGQTHTDPIHGFFTTDLIESSISMKIAIITGNTIIDETKPFTIYSTPTGLPYNIITRFIKATPLTIEPVYGDLVGYAVTYTVEKVANATGYVLDYNTRTWRRTMLKGPMYMVVLNLTGLKDPIDNDSDRIIAKALLSIYFSEYVVRNPEKFHKVYRVYRRALEGFAGLDIVGGSLALYYDSSKSLPEILYNINTILTQATHPLALLAAATYDQSYLIVPGFTPFNANLLSMEDSADMHSLIVGMANFSVYQYYEGLFKLVDVTILGYDDWRSSMDAAADWISDHGLAWISNGKYMVENATENHLELIPQRPGIKLSYSPMISPPQLIDSVIEMQSYGRLLYPVIVTHINRTESIEQTGVDYLIGYVFMENDVPVKVDSLIVPLNGMENNILVLKEDPYTIFSRVQVTFIEYSWRNISSTLNLHNPARIMWLDPGYIVCTGSTCTYTLRVVQNTSSVIEILFENTVLLREPIGRVYGKTYSIVINTSGLDDGNYTIRVRLISGNKTMTVSENTIGVDINPPIIKASIDVYKNQTVVIKWDIRDYSGISSAELVVRGPETLYYTIQDKGILRLTLSPGNYSITLTARDGIGHVASISKSLSVPESPTGSPQQGLDLTGILLILAGLLGIIVIPLIILWRKRIKGSTS